jgi:hypothetical protein
MHRSELRAKLPKGSTYFATWLDPIQGNRPRTTKRVVVSQSARMMQSRILDGPQAGEVVRLDWINVAVSEFLGVITLRDEVDDREDHESDSAFLSIDTIEGGSDESG